MEEISNERLKICYKCPLYSQRYGGLCNDKLWLNVNNGDVSPFEKPGYKRGCGCVLKFKVQSEGSKCPLEKW